MKETTKTLIEMNATIAANSITEKLSTVRTVTEEEQKIIYDGVTAAIATGIQMALSMSLQM